MALEEIELTMTNYTQYITTIMNGGTQVFWTPVICNICGKPALLHQASQAAWTAARKIMKGFTTEYKTLMKANKSLVTDMEEIIAKLHLTMPGAQ